METPARSSRLLLWASGILALGFLLSALIFGLFFYNARSETQTIAVVGSATERFHSDIAKWRLMLSRPASETGLSAGYAGIAQDLAQLKAQLHSAGIADSSISVQPVNAQPRWGPNGVREGYNLMQSLFVISPQPEVLEQLALNPGGLLREGAVLESSQLEYYYSQVAELKRSLLKKATEDAQRRASEIASAGQNTGVGAMLSARAGVFQITEPYSTEVSGMGMYSTATKEKEISVTVHATFAVD
ncbi:MAG TPA: SIMPL domain-containing protein [Rhodothermales bacterium]|nr:SIMPL domain-containing protein [Rhodothermales bacterium]